MSNGDSNNKGAKRKPYRRCYILHQLRFGVRMGKLPTISCKNFSDFIFAPPSPLNIPDNILCIVNGEGEDKS